MKATGLLTVLQVGKRELCILESGVISELLQSEVQFCPRGKCHVFQSRISPKKDSELSLLFPLEHQLKRNMAKTFSTSPGRSRVDSRRSSRCHTLFRVPGRPVLPGAPIASANRAGQWGQVYWSKTVFNGFPPLIFSCEKHRKIKRRLKRTMKPQSISKTF